MHRTGQTALNLAARHGHAEIVTLLLEAAAEPDHADVDGWTALRYLTRLKIYDPNVNISLVQICRLGWSRDDR